MSNKYEKDRLLELTDSGSKIKGPLDISAKDIIDFKVVKSWLGIPAIAIITIEEELHLISIDDKEALGNFLKAENPDLALRAYLL